MEKEKEEGWRKKRVEVVRQTDRWEEKWMGDINGLTELDDYNNTLYYNHNNNNTSPSTHTITTTTSISNKKTCVGIMAWCPVSRVTRGCVGGGTVVVQLPSGGGEAEGHGSTGRIEKTTGIRTQGHPRLQQQQHPPQ
ncbi:hypothetical protein Pmani_039796 [Petrolisthes manimaculis]|uniref:Uncharacterized protein n=1 Tax=Petrolisthes manimaculis TaxID=1843537 RepID=A0AAE1NDH3_9EUCA|nr:hypothetical protein Pmani_039796 [Petrolisthes manimaculis]